MKNKQKIDEDRSNIFRFEEAKDRMMNEGIQGFKFNYALEDIVQNRTSYECELKLSKSGDYLNIKLCKCTHEGHTSKYSSASCSLDSIQGIIFGGFSSRFWMLRKHFNSLDRVYYRKNQVPLYSW